MEVDQLVAVSGEDSGAKRRATSEDWTSNKKRAVSSGSSNGSPVTNGVDDGAYKLESINASSIEPEREDELERFRKAAIYRRMLVYRRECKRAFDRMHTLEESLKRANLERMQADSCWSNTMALIRTLIRVDEISEEELGQIDITFRSRVFTSEDFEATRASYESKLRASERVIKAYLKDAEHAERPEYAKLVAEYRELQQSNAFLTAETEHVMALLEDARKERDRYLEELRGAQVKIDRLESPVLHPERIVNYDASELFAKLNENAKSPDEDVENEIEKEGSPTADMQISVPTLVPNDVPPWDFTELQTSIQEREDRISELEKDNACLRDQVMMTKIENNLLPEDVIAKAPAYRVLLDHASKKEAQLHEERQELLRAREEIAALQSSRLSWQEDVHNTATKEAADLKTSLKKRDDDLNRLRLQRDQLDAQLKELKAVHENKWSSIQKYKALSESYGERLAILTAEVQRLRSRLAAASGDEDLLAFLCKDPELKLDYVEDLKKRLADSERQLDSLRATIRDNELGLLDSAKFREELELAKKRLAVSANDSDEMLQKLQSKEEELRIMKLKESHSMQETNALITELDRLSTLGDALQQQLHTQAITLEKWEEEREKLVSMKARADNKFYKVMSELDARDNERKLTVRNLEKQTKLVETVQKSEKSLQNLVEFHERELIAVKNTLTELRSEADKHDKKLVVLQTRFEEEQRRTAEYRMQMQKREEEVAEMNVDVMKLKEELRRAKREVEKAQEKSKLMNMSSAPSTEREARLQKEVNKCMRVLKCSICRISMRSTVLTKCMHSFCKGCVDARISLRHRKCPACNMTFSQSDVQTIYFQ